MFSAHWKCKVRLSRTEDFHGKDFFLHWDPPHHEDGLITHEKGVMNSDKCNAKNYSKERKQYF